MCLPSRSGARRKRNALSRPLIAELAGVFTQWRGRQDIAVAVLTGEGDKAFASGGDLKELSALRTEAETLGFAEDTRAALDTIRCFPVPVVAALNGDALGGGAELALACDIRIAAPHARIGFLQGRLAISTAWGGGTDLFRLLGPSRALLAVGDGRGCWRAQRALELGLIDAVGDAETPFRASLGRLCRPAGGPPSRRSRAPSNRWPSRIAPAPPAAEMAAIETRAFARDMGA